MNATPEKNACTGLLGIMRAGATNVQSGQDGADNRAHRHAPRSSSDAYHGPLLRTLQEGLDAVKALLQLLHAGRE